jgi:ribosomal protein S27E
MPVRLEKNAEPIPGYKLLHRLGSGGYGVVWKAEAPGGLPKAIKFVAGDASNRSVIDKELQALNRVKQVRHPFILSLERVDVVDGQLVVVMELADRDLRHRYKECKAQGLPGIPRDELLRYMEETAEALDLMNVQHGLQHLDIKPQNLFLVHNHVKVADFGLVAGQAALKTAVADGITPHYAAPERFQGGVSPSCDQYSLAIVFQELLTGKLPFPGNDTKQLAHEHLYKTPDLSALPAEDREAIRKALAKKPADRHACCVELIRALRGGADAAGAKPAAAAPATPETIRIDCPGCQRKGQVPAAFQGRSIKCPGCGKAFKVPFQSNPAAKDTASTTQTTPVLEVGLPEDIGLAPVGDQDAEVIEAATVVVDSKCPGCGHKGSLPEKFVGKKIKCPKCAKVFTVVDSKKAAPAPKPAAPAAKPAAPVKKLTPTLHGKSAPAPPVKKPAAPRAAPPQPAAPPPAVEEENPFAGLTGSSSSAPKNAAPGRQPPPEEDNPFANLTDDPKSPRRD